MISPIRWLSAAAVCFNLVAHASFFDDQGEAIPEDDLQKWASYLNPPNASKSIDFSAYDMSRKFTNDSEAKQMNWSATVSIVDAIWADVWDYWDSDDEEESRDKGERVLGFLAGIEYPDGKDDDLDDGWTTCMTARQVDYKLEDRGRSKKVPQDDVDVDPGCTGILSDSCISWLDDLNDAGLLCGKENDVPDRFKKGPCDEHFSFGLDPWLYQAEVNSTNITSSDGLRLGFRTGNYDPDTFTYYDEYVKSAFLVLVGWKARANETGKEGKNLASSMLNGSFACLRPTKFSKNSRNYGDIAADEAEEDDALYLDGWLQSRVAFVTVGVAAVLNLM